MTLSEGMQLYFIVLFLPDVSNEGPIENALCADLLLKIVVIMNDCNWRELKSMHLYLQEAFLLLRFSGCLLPF